MKKDTFYFSHDYNTRTDSKIKRLIQRHGYLGYGIYWAIIEDLYNNANALPMDYDCIAFDLHTDSKTIESIIIDFELFVFNDGFFSSNSVERRLNERGEKSEKARLSANKRWEKKKEDATAMQPQCEGNAIKEKKGKESKDINIDWRSDFSIYQNDCKNAFIKLEDDKDYLYKLEGFYPKSDIKQSLRNLYTSYINTEECWLKKKKDKVKTINWKSLIQNCIKFHLIAKQ